MDWFKMLCKYIPDELTDADVGRLVRYQKKVAEVERHLSEKEIKAVFGRNSVEKLIKKIQFAEQSGADPIHFAYKSNTLSLHFIGRKVLEDAGKVIKKRKQSAESSARYREKPESGDGHGDASRDATEKRRVDKSIYINKDYPLSQQEYDQLIQKLGKEKALQMIERFGNYIKSNKNFKTDSVYHTILAWEARDYKPDNKKGKGGKQTPGENNMNVLKSMTERNDNREY